MRVKRLLAPLVPLVPRLSTLLLLVGAWGEPILADGLEPRVDVIPAAMAPASVPDTVPQTVVETAGPAVDRRVYEPVTAQTPSASVDTPTVSPDLTSRVTEAPPPPPMAVPQMGHAPLASATTDPAPAATSAAVIEVPPHKPVATETSVVFDREMLISRGIDPKLAAMFNEKARFLPGLHKITLFVNGNNLGSVPARFDEHGQLCFDPHLMDKAGLMLPANRPAAQLGAEVAEPGMLQNAQARGRDALDTALTASTGAFSAWADTTSEAATTPPQTAGNQCVDFIAAYPQTDVDLRPNREEVRLAVPASALKPLEQDFSGYSSGGVAAILNYDALKTQSQFSGITSDFTTINTEAGLNLGDWSVRSRQTFTDQNGKRTTDQVYTYAEHSFVPFKSVLQVGQVNLFNPVLAGASITGVQVVPDSALRAQTARGATIEGIATTAQARVEVKQDGILIYSTVVPAGPFQLNDVPLLRPNANVDVTVFETDNSQSTFSLPAASLRQVELTTTGLSVAAGKVRNINDSAGVAEPLVVSAGNDWLISPGDKLSAGVMLAQDYGAVGTILDHVLSQDTRLSVSTNLSQASTLGKSGVESSLALSSRLTERLAVNGALTRQTAGYRALMDTVQSTAEQEDFAGAERTQFNLGANWNSPTYGGFGMNFMQSLNTDNAWDRTLSLSWGKTIAGVSINASVQHDISGDIPNSAYLSVSIPLGPRRSLRTFASRTSAAQQQVGTTYNETVNDMLNYSLTVGQQLGTDSDKDMTLGGNVSALPRYAQVSAGYTDNGSHSSNYNLGASGGLVLHANGLTASPYQVQDTFGIVSVGEDAGVKLFTGSGPIWTDAAGQAVLARLPAFSASQVEVMSYTLPRNADIDNGYKRVAAGRGSVNYLKFNVSKVRRVLLSATDAQGRPLAKGSAVFDAADKFVTVVLDEGKIYLHDLSQPDLKVSLQGGRECHLSFQVGDAPDSDSLFEQAPALCIVPGDGATPKPP